MYIINRAGSVEPYKTKGVAMRFYKPHTKFYCGVDTRSRIIYVCIIGEDKKILVHKKLKNQDTTQLLEIDELE